MTILLVEDDTVDAELFKRTCEQQQFKGDIAWVTDGTCALDFLFREGEYADAPAPKLVVLDLGLPGINGHEVLQALFSREEMRSLTIVVLSTSDREEDKTNALRYGARGYFTKPIDIDRYSSIIQTFLEKYLN